MFLQDKEARELQAAQQEVMALRARVHQLETDTHSSSSLELKNLSLQQVCAVLNTAHMCSTGLEPNVLVTIEPPTGLAKAPWVWQRTVCRDGFTVEMCMTTETAAEVSTHTHTHRFVVHAQRSCRPSSMPQSCTSRVSTKQASTDDGMLHLLGIGQLEHN